MASLDVTLGALLISTLTSYAFVGVIIAYTTTYYSRFLGKDRVLFQVMVGISVLCTLGDCIGHGWWCWYWLVTNYGNPTVMAYIPWPFPVLFVFMGVNTLMVQAFFTWRLWRVSIVGGNRRPWVNKIYIGLIVFLAVYGFAFVLWLVPFVFQNNAIVDLARVFPAGYSWLSTAIFSDIMITAGLMYHLLFKNAESREYSQVTGLGDIINRSIRFNVLSVFVQVFTILLFKVPNVGFWFLQPDFFLVPVYTFSLLISLNSRQSNQFNEGSRPGASSTQKGRSRFPAGEVNITVREDVTVDHAHRGDWNMQPVNVQLKEFGKREEKDLECGDSLERV
ncbi:hypothetical protein T439DRAFT_382711 [Meredithblackwellia eburnea MCA 4105]